MRILLWVETLLVVTCMKYQKFINSLDSSVCPADIKPGLRALWLDAKGNWDEAHDIVQQMNDRTAARIHAYLHRKEGDEWNAKYWHRISGSVFPEDMSLEEEWDYLVRQLVE